MIMKITPVLCGLLFFCAACVAWADDYRDLDDCMAGDFQSSVQACTRLLESQGHGGNNLASLYTLRGYAYAESGKTSEAIADFDKAIGLAPKSYDAYSLRGVVYHAMGREDLAIADSKQSTALMKEPPRDAIQHYCMGLSVQTVGATLLAIMSYDLAIKADPRLAAAYIKRSEVQGINQEFVKALAGIEKALQLDPRYSAAFLRRAQIYIRQSQPDKALADFTKAIELNPQYSAAYYWRGFAHEKKGDKERAIADYRQALAFDPSLQKSKEALQRLGGQSLRDRVKGALTLPNANWVGDDNYKGDYRLLAMHVQKPGRPVGVAINYYEIPQPAKDFLNKLRADAVAAPLYQGADIKTVITLTVNGKPWWLFRIKGKDGVIQDVWARNVKDNVLIDIMYTAGSEADFNQYRDDAMAVINQASAF